MASARRDFIALGIAAAAVIMFIGTGSNVLPQIVRAMKGAGLGPDRVLVNALLLNIALIVFAWRRYRQLIEEIVSRRAAEENARRLAGTDHLTGFYNRRSITDATDALLPLTQRPLAAIMVDLDNFKSINDFYGHGTGDDIIRHSAREMAALLPDDALMGRLGGDELIAILPFDPRNPSVIDDLAERIRHSLAVPVPIGSSSVAVTASIGLARSDSEPDGSDDAKTLIHMADIAMYHAKRSGRNSHVWFEPTMQDELRFSAEIEAGLRRGIPRGEFAPYYEQQVDLQSGRLTGFEMLSRWNSPALGIVSPDVFIPVAERIGAISDLFESVITQALEDARHWHPSLSLAVNVSPRQLRDHWFGQKLLKLLVSANFPPERLEIEITESCLHEDVGGVRSLMTSLKNQGIRVSLDDFGTGYSSLAQLRSLPFDRIKIDRTFVSNITSSRDCAALVRGITLLGEGLGLPITAEGIEDEDILERLREFGDIKGQGYLYGRPQNGEAVRNMLEGMGLLRDGAPDIAAKRDLPPARPRRSAGGR